MRNGLSLHHIIFEIARGKAPGVFYNCNEWILLNLTLSGLACGLPELPRLCQAASRPSARPQRGKSLSTILIKI